MSDVIRAALTQGHAFAGVKATAYEDWGTLDDWRRYCRSFSTLFVDIDGVVAMNEHPLATGDGGWDRLIPIQENVDALLARQASGRCTIVFATSRTEEYRSAVQQRLADLGFDGFELVMGLPHAQRILINDFAPTNPFPTASAVNIPRNAHWLGEALTPGSPHVA